TNASATLYAAWTADTYTVTYDANGGSGAPASQTKTHDVNLTLSSAEPTRDGYIFKGWSTNANGSVEYATGAVYTSDSDVTLYAVWEEEIPDVPETNANIVVTGNTARAGETVEVTIALENNPGIAFMRLKVAYDESALTLTGVKDAGILGLAVHSNNYEQSPYTLYWENSIISNNITSNGTVVTLTFTVNADAAVGTYPITVTYDNDNDDIMDMNFNAIEFNTVNSTVEVIEYIYGDVNSDGKITPVDSAYLSRHLASWSGYEADAIDTKASDVNCDGKVTAVDSAMLSRHLAGWSGYETLPIE
ncbi:MAG: InlB B-repeat-containing protein, partial [Clostridia bacterium]|nr:InlB B-repeat-containing protein [Clostridia bacterium]